MPQRITSEANPRVKRVVKLRSNSGGGGRKATGLLLAEGAREVSRAAAAGLVIEALYVCEEAMSDAARAAAASAASSVGVDVVDVAARVFAKMCYHREPEGVLAVAKRPATGLDGLPALDGSSLLLVAVGTEKPGNLGAMARTADAAGCSAVIAAGAPVDVFHPNAIRASTGSVFALPIATCGEAEAIAWLGERGVRVMAACVDGELTREEADYAGPVAIAIGPEDAGLNTAWAQAAARGGATVRIATAGRVADSLNASVAAGVLLFEAARRRGVGRG